MTASANFKGLKSWIGDLPKHGESLGLAELRWSVCALMSHRSADEIEIMLDVLHICLAEESESNWEFRFPPPEFNWELHGTVLWRCICSIPVNRRGLLRTPENWEYVGAVAMYFLKKAVVDLKREPIGLGRDMRVAGTTPQRMVASSRYWLLLASKEKESKFIQTGRKTRAAGEKGNRSVHKLDERNERHQRMRVEAAEIWKSNPALSPSALAKRIEKKHRGERGFGWRTVYKAIKE